MPTSTQPTIVRLWNAAAPGAKGDAPADIPTLTIHRPQNPDGSAMIICPGGGYGHLAPSENEPVAAWLNTLGITAFALQYRIAPYRHPTPLLDGQRGMRLVRSRAKEWESDASRVGIIGFWSGGHPDSAGWTHFG